LKKNIQRHIFNRSKKKMSKVLKIDKNTHDGFKEFLRFLLENGKVKGILCLTGNIGTNSAAYSLISDADLIEDTLPFFPLMPSNAATILSQLTLTGPMPEPVAVIIRPCELRGFIELVKRSQGSTENFLFISYTCGGVYPNDIIKDGTIGEKIKDYWNGIKKNEINPGLRTTCAACEDFVPYNADITVSVIGHKEIDNKCLLFLNNDKALNFAQDAGGEIVEDEIDMNEIDKLKEKKSAEKRKLFDEKKIDKFGLDGLVDTFGRCLGCHACGNACPVCYCSLCYFDSVENELKPSDFESELNKKGALRLPPNIINYHLGRMVHIGVSCVGCGSCSDACPVDIPVSIIFKSAGESIQKSFNYTPGKDVEEPLPISTFNIEEFSDIET